MEQPFCVVVFNRTTNSVEVFSDTEPLRVISVQLDSHPETILVDDHIDTVEPLIHLPSPICDQIGKWLAPQEETTDFE